MSDFDIITDAIENGTTLPAGNYYLSETVVITAPNKILRMDPKAVIYMQSPVLYQCLFRPHTSLFTIEGGTLVGTWDMALQGSDDIVIDPLQTAGIGAFHPDFRKLVMKSVTMRRFAGHAISFSSYGSAELVAPPMEFVFEDCHFFENFWNIAIFCYKTSEVNAKCPVKIRAYNCRFEETGRPATTDSATTPPLYTQPGGNHIGIVNGLLDLDFVNCKFTKCGRCNIELYRTEDARNRALGMVRFTKCRFDRSWSLALSIIGCNFRFNNCYIKHGPQIGGYIEFFFTGKGEFINNEIHGEGIFWPGICGDLLIENNDWYSNKATEDAPQNTGAIYPALWTTGQDPDFIFPGLSGRFSIHNKNNRFHYTHEPIAPTPYAINTLYDPENYLLKCGGGYIDEGSVYNNTTTRQNYNNNSTNIYTSVIPRGEVAFSFRTPLTPHSLSDVVTVNILENGNYTVTVQDSETTPLNISWAEREWSEDPLERKFHGKIKNFYWDGSGTKTSPEIIPDFQSFGIYDMQIHDVVLKTP